MAFIENGGSGSRKAIVNKNKQLLVKATTQTAREQAILNGDGYNVFVPVTFTVDTECDWVYIRNDDTQQRNLVIDFYDLFFGDSSNGSGTAFINFLSNPATAPSTIPAIVSNVNVGSPKQGNEITAFRGDGSTLNLGPASVPFPIGTGKGERIIPSDAVLPPGSSIGFSYTPPSSNSNQTINAIIGVHFEDPDQDSGD